MFVWKQLFDRKADFLDIAILKTPSLYKYFNKKEITVLLCCCVLFCKKHKIGVVMSNRNRTYTVLASILVTSMGLSMESAKDYLSKLTESQAYELLDLIKDTDQELNGDYMRSALKAVPMIPVIERNEESSKKLS